MAIKQHKPWLYMLSLAMNDLCNIQQGKSKACDLISLPKDYELPMLESSRSVSMKSRNSNKKKEKEKRSIPMKPLSINHISKDIQKGGKKAEERFEKGTMPLTYQEKIKAMGGKNVRWLVKKRLTATDVNPTQCRYYLPYHVKEILTPKEVAYLSEQTTNEVGVWVIDREYREQELSLRYWPSIDRVNLVKNWIRFTIQNGITAGLVAEIWSFRVPLGENEDDKLGFVIHITTG